MIHTTHYHCDWEVDFENSLLDGAITHDLEVLADTNYLTLDSWDLNIIKVEQLPSNSAKARRDGAPKTLEEEQQSNDGDVIVVDLDWEIDEPNPEIGSRLTVTFPDTLTAGSEVSVRIIYTTSKDGQAFSWLTAS